MKIMIENASRGIIEYDVPKLNIGAKQIDVEMEEGGYFRGTFTIISENDLEMKAIIYSTSEKVIVENPQFVGKKYIVRYLVYGETLVSGETLQGEFHIVTNGGEYKVPYTVRADKPVFSTVYGQISDYKQFAELVRTDAMEGYKVFDSPKFKEIIIGNRYRDRALYEGVRKGSSDKVALEEFLIGIGEKEPVVFRVQEESVEFERPAEPVRQSLTILKNTWGYLDVQAEVQGDFICDYKQEITDENFAGNKCEFTFVIRPEKLHRGKNLGAICFANSCQRITVPVTVKSEPAYHPGVESIQKKDVFKLMELYLQFRMQKLTYPIWEAESMAIVDRMRSNDDSDVMVRLMKAQMCVIVGKKEEAAWLLDYIQGLLPNIRVNRTELQCYYLYIRALQRRDTEFTKEAVAKIRSVYEQGHPAWQLLWFLLYLDDRYEYNKSLKYTMIKDRCNKGCISPLMYFEAVNVLNGQPVLLRVLNRFEILSLTLGAKKKYINLKLANQIAELAMKEKGFKKGILNILILLYETYQNNLLLSAICSTLIKGNCTDRRYFKWFELAVKNDVKITKLYEYYIFSIDTSYMEPLPQMVLMYFAYNTDSIRGRESYLFCNLIKNKQVMPHIYQNYLRTIEQFGIRQMLIGNMDEFLAVIYEEILSKSLVTDDIARRLPGMILSYRLKVDNPSFKKVVVLHKETQEEKKYPINHGVAYIKLYTADPVLLFEDENQMRYVGVRYEKTRLLDMEYYLRLSYETYPNNKYLRLHYGENYVNFKNNPEKYVSMFKQLMEVDDMDPNYKKELMRDIVDYYYHNLHDEVMDRYLLKADIDRIDAATRQKMAEIMILRGMYDEVYPVLKKYGSGQMDAGYALRFCTRMIEKLEDREEQELVRLSYEAFRKGKYDDRTLTYLGEYYYGTVDEMLDIWRAGVNFNLDTRMLEERILVQGMFVRDLKKLAPVFACYYPKGPKNSVNKAYLNILSYEGLIRNEIWDGNLVGYLEKEALRGEVLPIYNVVLLLRHYSGQKELSAVQKALTEKLVEKLLKKQIQFEFFKNFDSFLKLPGRIYEKTIFTCYGRPGEDAYLYYRFAGGGGYERKRMKKVVPGVWNAELILFNGDKLLYYMAVDEQAADEEHPVLQMTGKIAKGRGDSCFALINRMIAAERNPERYEKLLRDYQLKREMAEKLF